MLNKGMVGKFSSIKLAGLLIYFLLLTGHVNSQQIVSVLEGVKTGQTFALKNWKPDPNDPVLKIKTRDERGLIFAQDLEELVFKKYSQPRNVFDKKGADKPYPLPIEKKSNQPSRSVSIQKNAGYIVRAGTGQAYSNINPADPSIAVGPNHVIQMINGGNGSALFTVMDKLGNVLIPSSYMDQLPGSSYNGGGDCITFYDQLTDRFVMTEFGDSSRTGIQMNSLIMAVSATNDPTGSWYIYEFYAGFFPDYPKFGNWHDAWYGVTRDFTDKYEGNSMWAFDKQAMIAGANNIKVQRSRLADPENRYNSLVPVTLGGVSTAPIGTPGLFLYYNDDELTANPADVDSLLLLGFKINFDSPALSSFSRIGKFVTAAFESDYCVSRSCAISPGPQGYDVVSNRIMHKPMYRNFGTHQSIVANHTINSNGNGLSGIRWYEIRKNANWTLYQQNTFAPQSILNCTGSNERHRFMGSIMMNGAGQTLLAYNFSGKSNYASLAFTGRSLTSALNQMDQEEKIISIGTGFGTDANRWGDYNDIAPDPLNDSLFWFTGMYGNTENTWATTIAILKIDKGFDFDAKIMGIQNPSPCISSCQLNSNPQIRIRNNGNSNLNSLVFNSQLNNIVLPEFQWTGNLLPGEESLIELPALNFPIGENEYRVYIVKPNGQTDQNMDGNSSLVSFKITAAAKLPFTENAELNGMPPNGWSNTSSGSSALLWQKIDKVGAEGSRSFLFDNYNNNEPGKYGELITPLISTAGVDSISLSFSLAAALYDNNSLDTLEIRIYSNCSASSTIVYKKWGSELSTKPGFTSNAFVPMQSEWRKEIVDLTVFKNQNIQIGFRVINKHGQNIYLDDIQVKGLLFNESDIALSSVQAPVIFGCENIVQPAISFQNKGKDTLKTAQFNLYMNDKLVEKRNWTGNLPKNGVSMIQFGTVNTSSSNTVFMITVGLVNEKSDQNPINDTLRSSYQLLTPRSIPFNEAFIDKSLLNPWLNVSSNPLYLWEKTTTGSKDPGSLKAGNFLATPHTSQVFTPLLSIQKADSIFLSFDVAAAKYTGMADTLSTDLSWDCGKTWTTVYKKWGNELSTISNNTSASFQPSSDKEWRTEKINLTAQLWGKENFLLRFNNIGNGGNNIYLDNISIEPVFISEDLKAKGYAVGPNPANDKIWVRFFPYSTGLSRIWLMDAKGSLLYSQKISNGTNLQYWEIPAARLSEGIYFLSFEVNGTIVTEKILVSHQ